MTMLLGMLWFDNNPRMGLEDKIAKARDYYKTKHGRDANLVFVHPSMVPANAENVIPETTEFLEYNLRTSRSVMPNHFWVGVDNELTKAVPEVEPPVETKTEKPVRSVRPKASQWDLLEY